MHRLRRARPQGPRKRHYSCHLVRLLGDLNMRQILSLIRNAPNAGSAFHSGSQHRGTIMRSKAQKPVCVSRSFRSLALAALLLIGATPVMAETFTTLTRYDAGGRIIGK